MNGAYPLSSLITARDGYIYGTTTSGGTNHGYGTIFKMDCAGNFVWSISLNGTNGSNPRPGLIEGTDGNLYGTTCFRGTNGDNGTVFRITRTGEVTSLYSLNGGPDGYYPFARLAEASDGNFYATTAYGSWYGYGILFKMTPNGTSTTLHTFAMITSAEATYLDGAQPFGALAVGPDGNLYGTTSEGGETVLGNFGTLFRLSTPMPPAFAEPTMTPGTNLLTWTSVAGQTYQLQHKAHLQETNWSNLGEPITATQGVTTTSDPVGTNTQRWYRLAILP